MRAIEYILSIDSENNLIFTGKYYLLSKLHYDDRHKKLRIEFVMYDIDYNKKDRVCYDFNRDMIDHFSKLPDIIHMPDEWNEMISHIYEFLTFSKRNFKLTQFLQ